MRVIAVLALLVACGDDDGGGGDGGVTADGPPIAPVATCTVPPEGALVDTASATNVVGTGTPASCTEAALQAAVMQGGSIRFNCGTAPVTITVTQAIRINNVAGADLQGDTVIDGGGTVTLSGGGTSRIIELDACKMPFNNARCDIHPHPHLTVQRLGFVDGATSDPRGGAAIIRVGGRLTVIDSTFERNVGPVTGQDTAGGAIRLLQRTPALIVGSTFRSNRSSNGGALGFLQAAPIAVINTRIENNTATGNGGNPGNSDNGGGVYYDGVDLDLEMCGGTISDNDGNAYGGGIFMVDNAGRGALRVSNVQIAGNAIPSGGSLRSHGGATYLQGAAVMFANVTVSGNAAGFAAGVYVNGMNGMGSFNATNLTIANHDGDGLRLESGIAGTLLNATIAGNRRGIVGAGPLTLTNTIVAGNMMAACDVAAQGGAGSLQFPGTTCGGTMTSADPMLGALTDTGTTLILTMAPAAGGPAAGIGMACPAIDARGTVRPASGCTAGAHQLP